MALIVPMLNVLGIQYKDIFGVDSLSEEDTYCDCCMTDIRHQNHGFESCIGCPDVLFCSACAQTVKKDPPFLLMCEACEQDYDQYMLEHEATAEEDALGDRYGGYDQYDNMGGSW